jgi:parallel beta-helix repeat protein
MCSHWIALVGAFLTLATAPALARAVECGEVLTRNTVLDQDLDCAGDGLVIGAPGIVVDLADHIVVGSLDARARPASGSAGIRNAGFDRVVVRNGTVWGFETGVLLSDGANHNRISRLMVVRNDRAIGLEGSHHNRILRNEDVDNFGRVGIELVDANDNWVIGNRAEGGADTGRGIRLIRSHRNFVFKNTATGHDLRSISLSDSTANVVIANIGGSNSDAIELSASHDNVIARNLIPTGEGSAIHIRDGDRNHVQGNRIGSGSYGGIFLSSGKGNVITGNRISGTRHSGIFVRGSSTRLIRNWSVDNGDDGIHVDGDSTNTLILRNRASNNGDDGIGVEDATAVVEKNAANDNGDYGIEAVPGVTGTVNFASGNGNPAQCLNVSCF